MGRGRRDPRPRLGPARGPDSPRCAGVRVVASRRPTPGGCGHGGDPPRGRPGVDVAREARRRPRARGPRVRDEPLRREPPRPCRPTARDARPARRRRQVLRGVPDGAGGRAGRGARSRPGGGHAGGAPRPGAGSRSGVGRGHAGGRFRGGLGGGHRRRHPLLAERGPARRRGGPAPVAGGLPARAGRSPHPLPARLRRGRSGRAPRGRPDRSRPRPAPGGGPSPSGAGLRELPPSALRQGRVLAVRRAPTRHRVGAGDGEGHHLPGGRGE